MKILVVFDVSFPFVKGGAQRRFYEVARRLAAKGDAIDWMTFQAWPGSETIIAQGIQYVGIGKLPELYNKVGKRSKIEPLIFLLRFLTRCFRLKHYDAIWVGQWPVLHIFPALLFARLFGKRLIVDWWEVWSLENWIAYSRSLGRIGHFLQSLVLRTMAKSATIVTDSSLEMRKIRESVNGPVDVRWIPNGVPADEIGEVALDASTQYDIVSLGRLKNHKRVDLLIKAIWHLRESYGFIASVAIIGDGPERHALEAMAADLLLAKQVRFFGHVADPQNAYAIVKRGKVCVITTVNGGGGNLTLFEAYGCGLPVMAFRTEEGIDPELIEEGKTGIFVSPPSAEALSAALVGLLKNENGIHLMKQHAHMKSLQFNWNVIAEQYRHVLRGTAS